MPSSNKVRKVTSENYPTDAGREGELIFRLVYQQAGCKKPFFRLWLSSMEESAIREGFAHLKPSTEYDALYNAALCRERADWMVGINASRLFSCLYGQPLAVGRVMTPVLAMTVVREAAIAAFTPEKFYTVDLELTSGCTASSRRIPEKSVAENLLKACRKEMVATIQRITRKEKSENPPSLYDLTTLQRDANRLLGYSAQQTLDYVQSLYEKKLTTYPRTDSCYITDDDEEMLEELTEELEDFLDITSADVDEAVPRTRRTVNREKVTDHHAILPTRSMLQADLDALPKGEQNVLKLIIARTLMAVSKPFRYLETLLTTECAGEEFTTKGRVVLSDGWKAVERKMLGELLGKQKEPAVLPDVQEQSQCSVASAELKEGQTSPPKSYTEDTLLSAMQAAGAGSMPEGVERQGIGTPATRAATIEKLVQKGFLERKGTKKTKVLLPTDKGKALITVMPEEIQSPEMTADWETKLLQIERSEMEPETFMTEIKEMISSLVTTTEAAKGANALMKNKIIGVCPNCGKPVVEREKGWFCENRECRFVLWKDNAFFKRLGKRLDAHVADKLLRDGRVRLKDCKSAKGKTYNATVLLSCEADGRSKFSLEFEGGC
jgi:DNA topoisomerase-3